MQRSKFLSTASGFALILAAPAAFAQTANALATKPSNDSGQLSEIVVTARKQTERLQDVGHARVAAAGSTAHQFRLLTDLEAAPTVTDEPAAIRLHLWRDGEVVSFITPVERGFSTGQFMGMDAARWREVSAALRAGQGRAMVAHNASIDATP